ncbi:DUF2304 domain-containing protein [Frigoribacterium sp. Leaf164]|uniref:DUF2304 domain-containing protein n=1 Tax=Frigoribacterium sp. Leaf164 TaxID=1736282 RepID=UPI0009E7FD37|nr:DUF2304 domain-containing protein [Frigoribacterium sp. Leaf164]
MTTATYVFGIVSALLVLVVVFELLRRRRVRERHALWWLFAGVLALVVAVFPQLLTATAQLVGIRVPTNLSFFVSVVILFLVSVQHSAELTVLEDKTRTLAEHVALQDQRLSLLELAPEPGTTAAPTADLPEPPHRVDHEGRSA